MKSTIPDFFGQQSVRKSTAQPDTGVTPTEMDEAAEPQPRHPLLCSQRKMIVSVTA